MNIKDLGLNARTRNCLRFEGIETLDQLMEVDYWTLLKIPNFGKVSFDHLCEVLDQKGIHAPWPRKTNPGPVSWDRVKHLEAEVAALRGRIASLEARQMSHAMTYRFQPVPAVPAFVSSTADAGLVRIG